MQRIRALVYSLDIPLALQETILEALRLAFWAAAATLVTYLTEQITTLPKPEVWRIVLWIAGRLIEKNRYVANKLTSRGRNTIGLTF